LCGRFCAIPIDREMVRSINEIRHLTGKQSIAEFAENAEIIQMLTSLGVDYALGYGVAQPQRVLKPAVAKRRMPTALTVPQRGRVW
jgi:EAL domain-containing protein (putative c-di-GMP-specific phosphodiesterase class I)